MRTREFTNPAVQVIGLIKVKNGAVEKPQRPAKASAKHESSDDDADQESATSSQEDEASEIHKVGSAHKDISGLRHLRLSETPSDEDLIKRTVYVARSTHQSEFGTGDILIRIFDHLNDVNEVAQRWLPRQ